MVVNENGHFSALTAFSVSTLSWPLDGPQRRPGYLGAPTCRVLSKFSVLGVRGGVAGPWFFSAKCCLTRKFYMDVHNKNDTQTTQIQSEHSPRTTQRTHDHNPGLSERCYLRRIIHTGTINAKEKAQPALIVWIRSRLRMLCTACNHQHFGSFCSPSVVQRLIDGLCQFWLRNISISSDRIWLGIFFVIVFNQHS